MPQLFNFPFPHDFAFLLNPFHFSGGLPFEISPGVFLDKATDVERETIRELLKELGSLAKFGMLLEFEPIPHHVRNSPEWDRKWWPKETYWVLRGGSSYLAQELCAASQLCDSELELAALLSSAGTSGRMINQSSFFHYPATHSRGDTQSLDTGDIALTEPLRIRLADFEAAKEDNEIRGSIIRLFEKFLRVSAGTRHGELALLGHFALIEGLITHQPKHQIGDSINHQLKTKMPLLVRKFHRPLILSDYCNINDAGKVWQLLYGLRSRIAHGAKGFSPKADAPLRDLDSVFRLVRESLKRLFELALHEPEFLSDLKAC